MSVLVRGVRRQRISLGEGGRGRPPVWGQLPVHFAFQAGKQVFEMACIRFEGGNPIPHRPMRATGSQPYVRARSRSDRVEQNVAALDAGDGCAIVDSLATRTILQMQRRAAVAAEVCRHGVRRRAEGTFHRVMRSGVEAWSVWQRPAAAAKLKRPPHVGSAKKQSRPRFSRTFAPARQQLRRSRRIAWRPAREWAGRQDLRGAGRSPVCLVPST